MSSEKAIIFDLDGTLVDSRQDLLEAIFWLLRELRHPTPSADEVISNVGLGVRHLVQSSLPEDVSEDEGALREAVDLFREHYAAHLADRTRPYPGIEQALETMASAETPAWVLTNKPGYMARALVEALELDRLLGGVLGAGDVPGHKPDPVGLLEICGRLELHPSRAWYVGDMEIDVRTARAAGCKAGLVTWGYEGEASVKIAKPDRVIRSPDELPSLTT